MAYRFMLKGIAGLSDEGLRRNYLNKIEAHREIVDAWLKDARKRRLSLGATRRALAGEANLREPFERLVDTGLRLNELRSADGAARIPDRRSDRALRRRARAARAGDPGRAATRRARSCRAARMRGRCCATSRPRCRGAAHARREPRVQPRRRGRARAALAHHRAADRAAADPGLPLRRSSTAHSGGSANPIAISSACSRARPPSRSTTRSGRRGSSRRSRSAPRSCRRRTRSIEQRANELAIINSIQEGMAAELDFQAIVDLVGDKLREVFAHAGLRHRLVRREDEPAPLPVRLRARRTPAHLRPAADARAGSFETMLRTRQPHDRQHVATTRSCGHDHDSRAPTRSKSMIDVPIIGGDACSGRSASRTTSARTRSARPRSACSAPSPASMGVALENARLFDETQRLLKETEQRAAELAIINSVQEGLASKLEMQAIYDLVGNKIREIFEADDVGISCTTRRPTWFTTRSCSSTASASTRSRQRRADSPRAFCRRGSRS